MDHEHLLLGLGDYHDGPTSAEEANSIAELTREFEGALSFLIIIIHYLLFICNIISFINFFFLLHTYDHSNISLHVK